MGPMGPEVPSHLKKHPVLCVDGGAHFSDQMEIWVGDDDSFGKATNAVHTFRHPIEKDQSDLALAFELFKEHCHLKLHLWGFLGGRRDHEIFNLGEALTFLEEHPESEVILYDEKGVLRYHLLGSGHWKFSFEGVFSLGTLKKTLVKLTGECHYPITKFHALTPLSSYGLSNIGKGEMILETDGPVFLYFAEGE